MQPDQAPIAATLKAMPLKGIIEMFEETNTLPMTPALGTVRGWLMDGLEERDPAAFTSWIESVQSSPRQFYQI